jgi:hypothetical protein
LFTIGLISDSHGRAATTQRAVEALVDAGAQHLFHMGDIGGVEVIDALVHPSPADPGRTIPCHVVFGNVDWDFASLARYAASLGIDVQHPAGTVELAGKKIGFTHGHDDAALAGLADRGLDYLFLGHSHEAGESWRGSTRVINPGALFRAHRYTAACLDLESGEATFHDVGKPGGP